MQFCCLHHLWNLFISPLFSFAGPDYVKQQFKEPVEIKEVPVEKKDNSPKDSPHFYRKGTTPPHSPATSPVSTPPPSPHSSKKKGQLANSGGGRKTSREEKPPRQSSKEEKSSQKSSKDERSNRKQSKEERMSVSDGLKGSHVHAEALAKPAKIQQPPAAVPVPPPQPPAVPVNGELHSEYHSYYVKAPTKIPPPPDPEEDMEEEPSALALARMPPQSNKYGTPSPKPSSTLESKGDQKLRKQDSLKPKSLADTKKASMEIAESMEEAVSIWNINIVFFFPAKRG